MKRYTFPVDDCWCVDANNDCYEFDDYYTGDAIEKLAMYENAETEGRLVILPCKVGDTVYMIHRRFDGSDCIRETEFWWTDIPQLGKTVFLSREEAEKALEAKQDGNQ